MGNWVSSPDNTGVEVTPPGREGTSRSRCGRKRQCRGNDGSKEDEVEDVSPKRFIIVLKNALSNNAYCVCKPQVFRKEYSGCSVS